MSFENRSNVVRKPFECRSNVKVWSNFFAMQMYYIVFVSITVNEYYYVRLPCQKEKKVRKKVFTNFFLFSVEHLFLKTMIYVKKRIQKVFFSPKRMSSTLTRTSKTERLRFQKLRSTQSFVESFEETIFKFR
jgi:hypothetical protein